MGIREARAMMGGTPAETDAKLGGICGILFGIFIVAGFGVGSGLPYSPSQADQTLAGFDSLRTSFLASDIVLGLAAAFAIPFFLMLKTAFAGKDALLIRSATLLSIIGFVLTVTVFIGETVALAALADAYAAGGASRTAALVGAQVAIGFTSVLLFGFLLFAAGFGLYGLVTIRSRRFPAWLGYVGIVGAVLFGVGFLPFDWAFPLLAVGFVLFLLWILAMSAYQFMGSRAAKTAA